jgi:hypothetical protein
MLGYVSPTAQPDCSATFTFHLQPHLENSQTTRAMDEVVFYCRIKTAEHKVHLADHDFPKLGKRVSITWGTDTGKPKVLVTPLSPVISQSPQSTSE